MDINNKDKSLLFKFTPVNINLIRSLINSEIWFSSFNKLNDPYEGKFQIEKMKLPDDETLSRFYQQRSSFKFSPNEANRRIEQIKKNQTQFYLDLETDLRNSYFNRLKVACFSLFYNEILLWSHYADEHKGVSLIFDKSILAEEHSLRDSSLRVEYVEDKEIDYKSPRRNLSVEFCDEKGRIALALKNDKDVLFKKLECWDYESEYRFFSKETFSKKSDGLAVQYRKEALTGIIFGEKCSLNDIRLIHSILTNYGYVNPKFIWGASRIVQETRKLVSIQESGNIDIEEFILRRNVWLFKTV